MVGAEVVAVVEEVSLGLLVQGPQALVYTGVGLGTEEIVCDPMYDRQHQNLFLPFSGDPREENQTCKRKTGE